MGPAKQIPIASGDVEVVILDGGGFTTTDDTRLHADGHDQPYYLYDWCYYIHHKSTGRRVLWDLGISDVSQAWPTCSLATDSDLFLFRTVVYTRRSS